MQTENTIQTPCQFCHKPTNRTYRDSRTNELDTNLVSSCQSCSEEKSYLEISSIFKTQPEVKS